MDRTLSNLHSARSWLGFLVLAVVIVLASPAQLVAQVFGERLHIG